MQNKFISSLLVLALAPFAAIAQDAPTTTPEKQTPTAQPVATQKTSTPIGWSDDFEAAKKQAAEQEKDLLVLFTGSDWCGWCMRLDSEILSKDGFLEEISETFVPVFIDLPRKADLLSENAKKQNPSLCEKYQVQAFPTIILMDADGIAFAELGYEEGGAEKFADSLKKQAEDGKNSTEYKTKKEIAAIPHDENRIKNLDTLLAPLPTELQLDNITYVEEILEADPDGELGYRAKYPHFTVVVPLQKKFEKEMSKLSHEVRTEFHKIDKHFAEKKKQQRHEGILKQEADNAKHKAASEIFKKNARDLAELRDAANTASEQFADDSLSKKQLNDLAKNVDFIFEYYEVDDPSVPAQPDESEQTTTPPTT